MDVNERPKVLSLFSGCGGLDIGFHDAGYDIVGCVEIESQFCDTLKANCGEGKYFNPDTKIFCQDIRKFNVKEFKGANIECVIGGPPCQPFSAAGRRAGGVPGIQDERGMLFESYCAVLKALKPKVFIFENVYGLKGANDGEPWKEIVSAFSSLGYTISAEILDAADYGVPQHRERLIIVGSLGKRFVFPLPTHGPDSPDKTPLVSIKEALEGLQQGDVAPESIGGLYGHLLPLVPEGLNYSFFTKEMGYPEPLFAWRSKFHDFLYKADRSKPSRTLKAQPGKFTGPFHWDNRHFTIPELKRIQSIPDNYILTGNQGQKTAQIGNSVPPKLAMVLATSVKEQLLRPVKEFTYPLRTENFESTFRKRQRESTEYYKQLAKQEIERRFPANPENESADVRSSQSYYLIYRDLFNKKKLVRKPKDSDLVDCISALSVKVKVDNHHVSIKVTPVDSDVDDIPVRIKITGLTKYLQTIESVSLTGKTKQISGLFQLWDIIQDELVGMSQFFSLIDIYGHYANRGDVVKIETKCGVDYGSELSEIARALCFFGKSDNCGIFHTRENVASLLNIDVSRIDDIIYSLRSLRYDSRMTATQPTIRTSDIICTYPFPMLSERVMFK